MGQLNIISISTSQAKCFHPNFMNAPWGLCSEGLTQQTWVVQTLHIPKVLKTSPGTSLVVQ